MAATRWKSLLLSGWGRNRFVAARAARPERRSQVLAALRDCGAEGLIARGGGRSYGDCAVNGGGRVLLTRRLDRLLGFDPASGDVEVEAGVTFADLLSVFLPRGWLPPVMPGTAHVTVGGAIAQDVHGKNHETAGSFGDHLQWFDLLVPGGEVRRIDAAGEPRLFRATVAGIGLTGIILAAGFRLRPVRGNAVSVRERRVRDLDELLAALSGDAAATYSVAWVDAMAGGRGLGRGIVEQARPADVELPEARRAARRWPLEVLSVALGPWTVAAFNEIYLRRVPSRGRTRLVSYPRFLFPLDALRDWNRVYGRRGFYQFQCLLPAAEAPAGLRRLLETAQGSGSPGYLAVVKAMRGVGRGCLSFPGDGFTLALDLPAQGVTTLALLERLERLTVEHGGRVYLAKDSTLGPAAVRAMYPAIGEFRETLAAVDPRGLMRSDMAVRLGLREAR